MTQQPEFLYATLVLPLLFALTLVGEGVTKFMHRQSGWMPIAGGCLFLSIVTGVYFGFLNR